MTSGPNRNTASSALLVKSFYDLEPQPEYRVEVYSEEYLQFVVNHIQFGSAASGPELLLGSLAIRTFGDNTLRDLCELTKTYLKMVHVRQVAPGARPQISGTQHHSITVTQYRAAERRDNHHAMASTFFPRMLEGAIYRRAEIDPRASGLSIFVGDLRPDG
jgi:hypothetical protein